MNIPTKDELLAKGCNKAHEHQQVFESDASSVFVVPNPRQQRPIKPLSEILARGAEWAVMKKGRVWWTIVLDGRTAYLNVGTGEVSDAPKSCNHTPLTVGVPSRDALVDSVFAAALAAELANAFTGTGTAKNLTKLMEIVSIAEELE